MALRKPKIRVVDVINSITGETYDEVNYALIPKNFWWYNDSYWVGVQHDCWEEDEIAWDNIDKGAWSSLGSVLRDEPRNLSITNATYEKVGIDDIARIPVGTPQKGFFWINSLFPGQKEPHSKLESPYSFDCSVINTDTAEIVVSEDITQSNSSSTIDPVTYTSSFNLPAGSYIMRIKIKGYTAYSLPTGYRANPRFVYVENGVSYVYDPEYNIGRIPSDRNNPLLAERNAIIATNKQKDRPDWITYLISPEQESGEFSQIKFVVGDEEWSYNNEVITSIGPVLIKKTFTSLNTFTREVINFDPLARSISASEYVKKDVKNSSGEIVIPKGSYLFAGNRSTRTGANLALWVILNDGTINLLGTNTNPSTGVCECHLVDHSATNIKQDSNGKVYVLTKCSLHEYVPEANDLEYALPGTPRDGDGHPGGQALNIIGEKIYFFAEHGVVPNSDTIAHHFYNLMVDQRGNIRTAGDGTVFHGPNCATTWMNQLWGIYQDKSFSDPTAKQYIAHYDGLTWAKKQNPETNAYVIDSPISFKASEDNWQRVIQCNNILHVFGKEADKVTLAGYIDGFETNENGIMGVSDGNRFTRLEMNYRVLKGEVSPTNDADIDRLLIIAKNVTNNILDTTTFYLLEVDYTGEPDIFEYCGNGCFCLTPALTTEEEVEDFMETRDKYLWWTDGEWVANKYPPTDPSVCYLELTSTYVEGSGWIIQYCDICMKGKPCFSCDDFFHWNSTTDSFTITKNNLFNRYGVEDATTLPLFIEPSTDDSDVYIGSSITPVGVPYLERVITTDTVSYHKPTGVTLPFDPLVNFNAISIGSNNFHLKICETCELAYTCLNNCEYFFCWDSETGCFTISNIVLRDKYGAGFSDLPTYIQYDEDGCFTGTETPDPDVLYLTVSLDGDNISYCVPDGMELPFDPASAFGDGNALDLGSDGRFCPVHTCPPYDYSECSVVKIILGKTERGNWKVDGEGELILDDDGEKIFIPCDPIDGGDAFDTMPKGTKWKVIKYPRHGLPVNIIDLVDLNVNGQLRELDKIYFTGWYRNAPNDDNDEPVYVEFDEESVEIDPESNLTEEEQIEAALREHYISFLRNFKKRIKYDKLTTFPKPKEDSIEVLILVAPQARPVRMLPAVMRVI